MQVQFLGLEYSLEKGMATHSSILAWRIPWTEEPDRLQSMGLQRVRQDWSDLAFTHTKIRTSQLKRHIGKSLGGSHTRSSCFLSRVHRPPSTCMCSLARTSLEPQCPEFFLGFHYTGLINGITSHIIELNLQPPDPSEPISPDSSPSSVITQLVFLAWPEAEALGQPEAL